MKPVVSIVAPGAMGSAVGRVLAENGAEVRTSLAGRSAASAERARAAGMEPVPDETLAEADFLLSILPPGDAPALAERLAGVLGGARRKPVYVDANAVSPETVERIARIVEATGSPFVDAGIIGGPPKPGSPGPVFYASGGDAQRLEALRALGLDVRVIEGPVGAASALKMSYAGITKGLTALGAAMMLAATRAGSAEALHAELARSQPALLAWLTRQMPAMYDKAYRWVAEMEEIAAFGSANPATEAIYRGTARLYERLAADHTGAGNEIAALAGFVKRSERHG